MSSRWPEVALGELMTKSAESVELRPDEVYQEVTIKLWGKGVIERRKATGAEISALQRAVVRKNQFILSRIDARNGAFGLVPDSLDGAVVSNDFPSFVLHPQRVDPAFVNWLSKTHGFIEICKLASEGTTNRVRLKEDRFLATEIPLPPLSEQRRIVARIEALAAKIEEARQQRSAAEKSMRAMLASAFQSIVAGAARSTMNDVAPLIRRPVAVDIVGAYYELGIRSFGKGTFHKPPLSGAEIGTKRIFKIMPGDLLFNIVFAWEGAVAIAKAEDVGRVGSHRFLTCVPKTSRATAPFLCYYFSTDEGLARLGDASPGGAGRNRTLGIDACSRIEVPVPEISKQRWFDSLLSQVNALKKLQAETAAELDALLPSILDKAFKGEL